MRILGRWARSILPAAIIVLFVWSTALADHAGITFSQTNNTVGGTAIRGLATGGNDGIHAGVGVVGESTAGKGIGVWGQASHATGDNIGVLGESASTNGRGMVGHATASSGTTYGVYGESNSTGGRVGGAGYGVYGTTTASSGLTYGVYGQSASASGYGVFGRASASSGATYGVYGQSASASGYGVFGRATAASGITYGVYGLADSTTGGAGTGVFGLGAFGVIGWSNHPYGIGVRGVGANGAQAGSFGGDVVIYGNLTVYNGTIRLSPAGAKPACDVSLRGAFWLTQGGAGVKDALEVCAKDATDTYAWRTLY